MRRRRRSLWIASLALAALLVFIIYRLFFYEQALIPATGGIVLHPTEAGREEGAAIEPTPTVTPAATQPVEAATTQLSPAQPPVNYVVGSISGTVWWDTCFQRKPSAAGPAQPSQLCTPVSEDRNQANGFLDQGEPGIANVKVTLGTGACPSSGLSTAWTDIDGIYYFGGLVSGKYCVSVDSADADNARILDQGGWTYPGGDGAMQTITLVSGESRSDVNFGWDRQLELAAGGIPTPVDETATLPPTDSASGASPTPVPATTSPQATPPPASGTAPDLTCNDRASFVADVTVPDDSAIAAGTAFVKTWRIRNDGDCTWRPGEYSLAYIGGDWMGGPGQAPLPAAVPPGETVDLSVDMVAPAVPGTYTNLWVLRRGENPTGSDSYLGVGQEGTGPLYARIIVPESGSTAGIVIHQTPTPAVQSRLESGFRNDATSVRFDPGTTSSLLEGMLGPGETAAYALRASGEYSLIATLRSDSPDLRLDIAAEDGTPLALTSLPNGSLLVEELPSNQRYIFSVSTGGQKADYSLLVEIPAPVRLSGGSGTTRLSGDLSSGRRVLYLLRGQAGQELSMSVFPPGGTVAVSIFGLLDGQSAAGAASNSGSSWSGRLPQDGGYLISIEPLSPEASSFTLELAVQ